MSLLDKDIKAIIDTDEDTTWAIADANLFVTEMLAPLNKLTAGRLELITKYLAAHFVAMKAETGGLVRQRVGTGEDEYAKLPQSYRVITRGFNLTRYGQQAIALDTTGTLAKVSSGMLQARFQMIPIDTSWSGL